MEIREALPDEFETLGRITVEAYRQLQGGVPLGAYEDNLLDVAGRAADSVVLVAVDDDGEMLGGVTYVPDSTRDMSEFEDPEAAGVRMLAVRPDRQGAGVGRALTEACIARARADGRRRVLLHSTAIMEVARAMYGRMGFEEAPDLDAWVTGPSGGPLRLIAFRLPL
ncbi:MAG TPA: GNAT family N-acetyltransferase [Acidimicrobiales bacterium]|nr:GNAT family N-acetyltransferase [Acidimicrobiales bacterium]